MVGGDGFTRGDGTDEKAVMGAQIVKIAAKSTKNRYNDWIGADF